MYYIGIDAGGTLVKASVFDASGRILFTSGGGTRVVEGANGRTERDMDEFFSVAANCARLAINGSRINAREIGCVACTGHGKGLYPVDKNGRAFMPGMISTDTRAHSVVSNWKEDGTERFLYERTAQKLTVPQPAALLRWLKDKSRADYDRIGYVFEAKDYIRYRLTGKANSEYTDSSGTNLMNIHKKEFDPEVFDALGIPEMLECMPPLISSCDIAGYITKEASEMTGIPIGVPVAGGMFDIDACALASGAVNEGDLCVIAGTWSINEYVSHSLVTGADTPMNSVFCLPGRFLIEESSPTSACNLEWLSKNVFPLARSSADTRGANIYAEMDALAENCPADREIYYLPYIFGSARSALDRAAFVGMDASSGKPELVRAVLEGVAFNHRLHIDMLISAKGSAFSSARMAGGAAKSELWVSIFADAIGIPMDVVDCPELGTLGCAIAAATATGEYKSAEKASQKMVPNARRVFPNGRNAAIYDKKYKEFKRLAELLAR